MLDAQEKYLIENRVYNTKLNDKLWNKLRNKEELTKEEHDYLTFCYHYEEFLAYGEI